jgi:hypothetical protein
MGCNGHYRVKEGKVRGAYSYIRILPDRFLLKVIVFTVCEHEHMSTPPPSPNYRV